MALMNLSDENNIIFELRDKDGTIREFQVGKSILGAASEVFQAMLFGPLAESSEKIEIKDVTYEAFEHLAKYASGKNLKFQSVHVALDVACAARKYLIGPLLEAAIEYARVHLTLDSAIMVIEDYHTLDSPLNNDALKMIMKNLAEVKRHQKCYFSLPTEHFKNLLRNSDGQLKPKEVYDLAYTWAEYSTADGSKPDKALMRSKMETFLPYIRFLQMTMKEFVQNILPSEILTIQEAGSIALNLENYDGNIKSSLPAWCSRACFCKYTFVQNTAYPFMSVVTGEMHAGSCKFSVSREATLISFTFRSRFSLDACDDLKIQMSSTNSEQSTQNVKASSAKLNTDTVILKYTICFESPLRVQANQIYELTITKKDSSLWVYSYLITIDSNNDEYTFGCPKCQTDHVIVKVYPCDNWILSGLKFCICHPSFLI